MKPGLNTTHTNRNQVYRKPNYGLGNDRFPSRRDGGILSDSSGRVPKWSKGTDCKSVIRGFESHLGLLPETLRRHAKSFSKTDLRIAASCFCQGKLFSRRHAESSPIPRTF